ncbi:MAG: sigma-70 family RNA polymerase sigma factor [Gemmatimonadaceae bacterium]
MTESREDPEITRLIRTGDRATLEFIARDNADMLLRGARASGFTTEAAADVVQDTLLVFCRKAEHFDGRASVRSWLYGILLNKISERQRTDSRERVVDDIDAILQERFDAKGAWITPPRSPDAYTAGRQAMDWLERCVEALPQRHRLVFMMRELEGMDVSVICNILGLSANNLGVILFRARASLRECLERKGLRGSVDVDL